MTAPPFLKQGDKVAIVSTARKILRSEIEYAIATLESWGLEVVVGDTIDSVHNQFAGTDIQRISDFQKQLIDPEIKAIICARGGYGTVRIIDNLDFQQFLKNPKWIVGYSDVTVLHSHLTRVYNVQSLHATMPINYSNNTDLAISTLKCALFGEPYRIECATHILNKTGSATGAIVGGNLSILYSLMGSVSQVDTDGKILFLEDLDEYLYHIDRMMQNLRRANKLANLAGLIVGGMTEMNDNEVPFGMTAEEIISEAIKDYDYPVCFGFPSGHINDNRAIYMNKKANLIVGDTIKLAF